MDTRFDGDKGTLNILMLNESVEEARRVMKSRNFHVRTDGSISHSLTTETVNYLLGSLTGKPNVTKEEFDKFAAMYPQSFANVSKENFFNSDDSIDSKALQASTDQEEVVTIDDITYSLSAIVQAASEVTKIKMVPIHKLEWMLELQSPSEDDVLAADVTEPVIVTPYKGGVYWVIDGLARVKSAVQSGLQELPVKVIPTAKLGGQNNTQNQPQE